MFEQTSKTSQNKFMEKKNHLRSNSTQKNFQSVQIKDDKDCSKKDQSLQNSQKINTKFTIKLGICAMKKKIQSRAMKQIMQRMACKQLEIIQMWDCLTQSWKTWPKVDALMCFYSDGFPYFKAWNYVNKNKPFLINNLDKQQYLWDRSVVYDILTKIRIPMAKHFMIFRDLNYLDSIQQRAYAQYDKGQNQIQDQLSQNLHRMQSDFKRQSGSRGSLHTVNPPIPKIYENKSIDKEKSIQHQQTPESEKKKNDDTIKDDLASDLHSNESKSHRVKLKMSDYSLFESKYPNTLKAFHEKRKSLIKIYDIQEVQDYLLIKYNDTVHKLKKPFVQKPFDSQNHSICVYYPQSMGGGRKMLFRKINNSSSQYQQNKSSIRRDGNYIYEQFLPTNAFDIKVYTIGAYYMYAQARKAPTLDGVVQRAENGKQKRFPVILTPDEKFICHKIVQQFGQEVCGFDLLRANGKSYVCDVNGWSFVKANSKYWDDCAIILKRRIFKKFFPEKVKKQNLIYQRFSQNLQNQYRPPIDRLSMKQQQLRSIVSIFRHGDRSPKLKLKIKSTNTKFLQFFNNTDKKQLKMKDPKNLTKILNVVNSIIASMNDMKDQSFKQFTQMKWVLQSGGHFEGLNRKLQMKVIQRQQQSNKVNKILIVLKWGGQLSCLGYHDSVELGRKMRMQRYQDDKDFLSLFSSYRHDLKTYSSDQGRCIKTAAAFLKGFLNIQGSLAPIITSMVMSNKKARSILSHNTELLDCTSQQNHSFYSDKIRVILSQMLNSDECLMQSYLKHAEISEISQQMFRVIKQIGNPKVKLAQIDVKIRQLVSKIQNCQLSKHNQCLPQNQEQSSNTQINKQDIPQQVIVIYKRWLKLQKDFYCNQKYNISKIPQIYDTIRHDLKKNSIVLNKLNFNFKQFLCLSKLLAYFVVPNQYGMNDQQKIRTATDIASPLVEKILIDLMFWKQKKYQDQYWKYKNDEFIDNWKHIRTRLYFTSASHMYSILNLFTLGNQRKLLNVSFTEQAQIAKNILYMSYLSHIQFRLYQNLSSNDDDPNRFRLEMSISSEYSKNKDMKQVNLGGKGVTIQTIKHFIQEILSNRIVRKSQGQGSRE